MDLSEIEGVGTATRRRLVHAGIKDVRDLAAVNTRDTQVDGIGRARLQELKKSAQKRLYQAASGKVVTAARRTGEALAASAQVIDQKARSALREALEAAWEAEHRALEAIRASQTKAQAVAEAAAARAQEAHEVASAKAQIVLREIHNAPARVREAWGRYETSANDAQSKARAAAARAAEAARAAGSTLGRGAKTVGTRVQEQARTVGTQGRSFLLRLKEQLGGDDEADGRPPAP